MEIRQKVAQLFSLAKQPKMIQVLGTLLLLCWYWIATAGLVFADANTPTDLRQFQTDGITMVPVGGSVPTPSIRLPYTFDTTDSTGPKIVSTVTSTDQSGTTATVSVTPAGVDRLLVVHVAYDGAETVSSADFDGQAMTKACTTLGGGFANDIWYLVAPNETTADVTLNFTGGGSPEMAISISTIVNVDQGSPIADSACDEDEVGGTNPTVTVTANDDQLIYGGVSTYTQDIVLTPSAAMTENSDEGSANIYGKTATAVGANGATTLDWAIEPDWPWSSSAVVISPAVAETPVDFEVQYEIREVGTDFTDVATDTVTQTFQGIPLSANSVISSLADDTSYHWQVRSCSQDLLTCSSWQAFGGNPESEADFTVAGANPPNDPTSLGPTEFVDGSSGTNAQPELTFDLSDPDFGEQVQYRIQIGQTSDFSTNVVDYTSALGAQGSFSFTVGQAAGGGSYATGSESQVLYNGNYYWQVLAIDAAAHSSSYSVANSGAVAFVITGSLDPDFPVTPVASKQYKSNDQKLLPVGAETTDPTEHVFVKMKTTNETPLAYSNQSSGTSDSTDELSFSMDSAGTNRLLVVNVSYDGAFDANSVTYDGQALTKVCEVTKNLGSGSFNWNQIWYLVAPNVTTSDVVISFAGTNTDVNGAAALFTGVDQGTPFSNSNCQSSPSQDHHPALTVSSNEGEIVFGGVSTYTGFVNQLTPSPYVDQVSDTGTNNIVLRTGYQTAVDTSTTLEWTGERNWPWLFSAVSIRPVSPQSSVSLIPRVEIQPVGVSFSDTPNFTGSAVPYAGEAVYGLVSTPGRVDGTSYHWQAQACTDDLSYCSAWSSFGGNAESETDFSKIANLTPDDPDRLGDTNVIDGSVTGIFPAFQFRIADPNPNEQLQFRYQISTADDFSAIVMDYTSGLADQFTIEGLSELSYFEFGQDPYDGTYAVGGQGDSLLPDTTYYWRVQAIDSGGLISGWSDQFFTTNADAPAVSNVQITSITSSTVSLTWDTDLFSNSYVGIGPLTGTTTDTVATQETPRVLNHSYTASGLLSCASYTVYAKSANSEGTEGQSLAQTFDTAGCLGDGSIEDTATSFIDSAAGGSVSLLNGGTGMTVTVPIGAHAGSADWQLHKLTGADVLSVASPPPNGTTIGDFFFDVKDMATAFAEASITSPVTVTLNYGAADLQGHPAAELKMFRWTGSAWTVLDGCLVDELAQSVSCTTTSTGVVGLFAQSTPVPGPNPESSPSPSTPPACDPNYIPAAPDLFLLTQVGSTATVTFSPSTSSISTYEIGYGTSPTADNYLYSYTATQTSGVQQVPIAGLDLRTYYFRVRAVTGCASSDWSRVLASGGAVFAPYDPSPIPQVRNRPTPTPEPSESPALSDLDTSSASAEVDAGTGGGPDLAGLSEAFTKLTQVLGQTVEAVTEAVQAAAPEVAKVAPAALVVSTALAAVNLTTAAAAVSVVAQQGFSPSILWQLLRALGLLPAKAPQGYVYSTDSEEPVAFSLIHIEGTLAETGEKIIETVVSDTRGMYSSVKLAPGAYIAQSRNQGYSFPTKLARQPYVSIKDFYKGEKLDVDQHDPSQFLIIPVDGIGNASTNKGFSVKALFGWIQHVSHLLLWPLFALSVLAVWIHFSAVNVAIVLLYVVSILWQYRRLFSHNTLRGKVADASGQPIRNAMIRLINQNNFQLVAAAVTDKLGKYELPVPAGKYIYQVVKTGYLESGYQRIVLHEIDTKKTPQMNFALKPFPLYSWEQVVGHT